MVAALWSNSNWDDDKGTRTRTINDLTAQHEEALEAIESALTSKYVPESEKLDRSNPFFAAAERGLQKIEKSYDESGREVKVEKPVNYMHGLDQEQDG